MGRVIHEGVGSIYPGKIRKPLSFTATPEITRKLARAEKRLRLSRSDIVGLLVDYVDDEDMARWARTRKVEAAIDADEKRVQSRA